MKYLRLLLAPLAPAYAAMVRARNRAFDAHPERVSHLPVPVLSLGNLAVGGTGKTPVTLYLAEALHEKGYTNVVLSRGYGGKRPVDPMDVTADADPRQTGDEPLMMARRLGASRVVVGRKRWAAGQRALSQGSPRLFLLDDGFQHRGLKRDLDLLLLDGVRRWSHGRMLPLGDLREPMEGAKRAHALVVTRASRAPKNDILDWWARYGSGGPVFWIDFAIQTLRHFQTGLRQAVPGPDAIKQGHSPDFLPFFAFCGLGHPEAFYADLMLAGCPWVATKSFQDHQRVSRPMLHALAHRALAAEAKGLVCTEKDAVKFSAHDADDLPLPLWIAEQQVQGGEALLTFVVEHLESMKA